MKLIFINDKYAETIFKTVSDEIKTFGPGLFEGFKVLEFGDDKRLIEKFDPDLILYLYSLKAIIHRQQVFNTYKNRYRFACWLLEDKLIETTDVGHFYDFVFTVDKNNLEERRQKYRYKNIYFLSADDIYNRLRRIQFIYNNINKDRRFNDDVKFYNENVYL
jgi:hypothetical protein